MTNLAMKKTLISLIWLYTAQLSLLIPTKTLAQDIAQLDSHVHGVSELTIALVQQQLEIEIRSPAINLVGFEYKATTKQERAAVKKAALLLHQHKALFLFSGGSCGLLDKSIDLSSISPTQHTSNNHQTSSTSPHKHHEHEHEHEKNTNKVTGHHNVVAKYRYHCKKPSTLQAVTVKVLTLFSGVNEINAHWLTETKQGAVALSLSNPVINLR